MAPYYLIGHRNVHSWINGSGLALWSMHEDSMSAVNASQRGTAAQWSVCRGRPLQVAAQLPRLLQLTAWARRFVRGTQFPKVPVGPERPQSCNMSHV